jgi:uncharacterized repeat protein (TIGR03837 family)
MAPHGAAGVTVIRWVEPVPPLEPGDVVVEAFGCDPPPAFVTRMSARRAPPMWINLEYLSAEAYVERCHGLPSPQHAGPGAGLRKWFYFPGFTAGTGGLLRERRVTTAHTATGKRSAWWRGQDVEPRPGECVVSLFCYPHAPFDALFERLDATPTLLLLAAGAGQAPGLAAFSARPRHRMRVHALPWLTQTDYDRMLAACDLNFARGEDSIVRAMWAGAPFVWHIYRQDDSAHAMKLGAMLDAMHADSAVQAVWRAWNDLGRWPAALPPLGPWRADTLAWRERLWAQPDLTTQLLQFVATRRAPG